MATTAVPSVWTIAATLNTTSAFQPQPPGTRHCMSDSHHSAAKVALLRQPQPFHMRHPLLPHCSMLTRVPNPTAAGLRTWMGRCGCTAPGARSASTAAVTASAGASTPCGPTPALPTSTEARALRGLREHSMCQRTLGRACSC